MDRDSAIYTAYDDHRQKDPAESERNLMRAVLRTAMEDIRRRGEAHRDARRYFLSLDDHYLFSFLSVCNHLELCPKTICTVVGLTGGLAFERGVKSEQPEMASA